MVDILSARYRAAWLEKTKGYTFRCYHRMGSKWWQGVFIYQEDKDTEFYEYAVTKWIHHRTRMLYWNKYAINMRILFAESVKARKNYAACNWCMAQKTIGPDNFSGRCSQCWDDLKCDAMEGNHVYFLPHGETLSFEKREIHRKIQAWVEYR